MTAERHLLILGGARSGKSVHAEERASAWTGERVYLASGQPFDDEMRKRIARHQQRRTGGWITIEEPVDITGVLKREAGERRLILFDCVTLWVSNLLLAGRDVQPAVDELTTLLVGLPGQIILVSNEVGQGIVPDNELARQFRDEAGLANQRIAAAVAEVVLVTAGLPQSLKSS